MNTTTVQLSTNTLEWAARKAGKDLPGFASSLYSKVETINNIVKGQLTISQIRKFADSAKVPFGFLFLPSPPQEYIPDHNLVDFRTVYNRYPLSNDFLEVYKDVEHKQSWYRDYLISIEAQQLDFVGKFKNEKDINPSLIAGDIRNTIGLNNISESLRSSEKYYSFISNKCEENGILVFKNSVVVNATRRKLNHKEFRGFVISDSYAPAIFINGEDTKYANIFTLAHELAHIWLGESGVSDAKLNTKNRNEIRCNQIAAELLVPLDIFIKHWDSISGSDREKISSLNKIFLVSELVIARIALINKKTTGSVYKSVYTEIMKHIAKEKNKDREESPHIPFSVTAPIKNSRLVTKTVINLVKSNRMSPSEAAILLNISASKVFSL